MFTYDIATDIEIPNEEDDDIVPNLPPTLAAMQVRFCLLLGCFVQSNNCNTTMMVIT